MLAGPDTTTTVLSQVDVDGNGQIDVEEFAYMVRNYLTDDDI